MKLLATILLTSTIIIISSCQHQNTFDEDFERAKIIEMLMMQDEFLLTEDINIYRAHYPCFADSTVYINKGTVHWDLTEVEKTDSEINHLYAFDQIDYHEIYNKTEPTIKFSPDGKMAYVVGHQSYKFDIKDSLGHPRTKKMTNAYLEVLVKNDGCWTGVAIAQTFDKN
ncbi:hypothetical protein [Carboxylicivirga sp. M1479]|uniref:hypothetical protein n=1 Tax=Carboxylicivirga sp. M1479 TaxID=2594476 RepID=UPI00117751F6|nr:hypothetical protein [Carboxylicivirga sp. M1479]TRX72466.1 hypothetical protein FNN09_00580 [Carboxylicivirga sp. M1479]